ncbi:uncharacterized protein LOC100902129 [Galendromus occidentalis]|uniref:Uncharacterized protein LOC100902129 n=1 Tax=Galendromus occidentalis TaxID=34638 RepID=A0AAJ7SGN6_9ACAR|nr:uncharacterized protein LOC100902129 [Galendromus occidentalis]
MWPFVKEFEDLPSLAAEAGLFREDLLESVTCTFSRIARQAGTADYHGKLMAGEHLKLLRALSNKKSIALHVMMSVENFRNFEALTSYEMDETDWERFLLRDASVFFVVVLQETLLRYKNNFDFSELVGELLMKPQTSRLFVMFSEFFNNKSRMFVEEFSYCVLFCSAMWQTSANRWKEWMGYKHLPEPFREDLCDNSANPAALAKRTSLLKRLTLTDCINPLFLRKKLESLVSDDLNNERRRFAFTLCVMEPENKENYKSLIRILAVCSELAHVDRIKSWLEDQARCDPNSEAVADWDDDEDWESIDEDEEASVEEDHIKSWNAIAYRMANNQFIDAIALLDNLAIPGATREDTERRNLIWGYAASHTNDRDLLKRARRILTASADKHPIANYWLAEMSVRLSSYPEASSFLDKARFELVAIPFDRGFLKPSTEEDYASRVKQLKETFRNPLRADYMCCRQGCDLKGIFRSSLGFNGIAQVTCGGDCLLNFHADCWKIVVQKDLDGGNKHRLGSACYTPDCPGRIILVKLFNSNMQSTKEYRWKDATDRQSSSPVDLERELLDALRLTIYQTKDHFSQSEILTLCRDISEGDCDRLATFVETCFREDQRLNPPWTKAQWLQAMQSHFEKKVEAPDIERINSDLNSLVLVERLSMDEVESINLEYSRVESELSELLNEECNLREEQHRLMKPFDNLAKLQDELEGLTQRERETDEAEKDLGTLRGVLDLKRKIQEDFKDELRREREKLSEADARLREGELKYISLRDERSDLLRVVKENALEARASLRRALMELNETRYVIASDSLLAVEQAVGRNIRAAEAQRNPDLKEMNRAAKRKNFELLNDIVTASRTLEETTKATTIDIQNGRLDAADVESREDCLQEWLQRYSNLPDLSAAVENQSLEHVARILG